MTVLVGSTSHPSGSPQNVEIVGRCLQVVHAVAFDVGEGEFVTFGALAERKTRLCPRVAG